MSGTNEPHPPAGEPGGADPSMEDILASIRRILNEDEVAPASPAAPHEEGAQATPVMPNAGGSGADDGVLVLDEAMLVPSASAAPTAAEPPPVSSAAEPPPAVPPAPGSGLLAPDSAAAAAASVGALLRTLSSERTTQVHRGGPTIEDLVREELRPLLKVWLDQYLPPMVERLVRQEIERLAGHANP